MSQSQSQRQSLQQSSTGTSNNHVIAGNAEASSCTTSSSSSSPDNSNNNSNNNNKTPHAQRQSWNVDICAAVIADRPPKLPLREELQSLGFEVILGASGVGAKVARCESKVAVEAYRRGVQYHDLQKRRLFPKCKRRIREKIHARKQIEDNLAVPHACSYESYEMKLRKTRGRSMANIIGGIGIDNGINRSHSHSHSRPWRPAIHDAVIETGTSTDNDSSSSVATMLSERVRNHQRVITDFPDLLFLAPDHRRPRHSNRQSPATTTTSLSKDNNNNNNRDHYSSSNNSSRLRGRSDYVPEVFGAFDNLDNDDLTSARGSASFASVVQAQHDALAARYQAVEKHYDEDDDDEDDQHQRQHQQQHQQKQPMHIQMENHRYSTEDYSNGENTQEEKKGDDDSALNRSYRNNRGHNGPERPKHKHTYFKPPPLPPALVFFQQLHNQGKNHHTNMAQSPGQSPHGKQEPSTAPAVNNNNAAATNPFDSAALSARLCLSAGISSIQSSTSHSPCHAATDLLFHEQQHEQLQQQQQQQQQQQPSSSSSLVRLKAPDWMSSAKNVFDTFSSEVLKVTSCEKRAAAAAVQPPGHSVDGGDDGDGHCDPVSRLFGSLTTSPDVATIQSVLAVDPDLAYVRREEDGRLPLHVLADQRLPIRKNKATASQDTNNNSGSQPPPSPLPLIDTLLLDISMVKQALTTIVDAHPGACTEFDKKLDLPVHLIARRLMEWEATWYESIYHAAAQETEQNQESSSTEVSELYHAMSETVERLLLPITKPENAVLCQSPGGMGTILPLHIASIFTVSVRTTRLIVEAFPDAARIPCDLGILQTFVPDECLAIELHDNLSTDFPKWELNQDGESNQVLGDEDRIRRSDLLFAYNPIEPHRFEKGRISRFELQIQFDATVLRTKPGQSLDAANRKVWIWMCSFCEPESGRATYANNVKRIVRLLAGQSFQHLKDLVVTSSNSVAVQQANADCLAILQQRSDEINAREGAGVFSDDDVEAASLERNEPVVRQVTVTVEDICRCIFHIPDVAFPSGFIILPYKLRRSEDGSMSLETPEQSSDVAARFAQSLICLTEPEAVQDLLKGKWEPFDYAQQISAQNYARSARRLRERKDSFLALYRNTVGYFYVLDKQTGLPDLLAFNNANYPYVLPNPTETISLLFPLMMMGMVQMRGDKAIPKLAKVCTDKDLWAISPGLGCAVRLVQKWMAAQPHTDTDEMKRTIDRLVVTGQSIPPLAHSNSERFVLWSIEIMALQSLIDAVSHSQERALPREDAGPSSPTLKSVSFADNDRYPEHHSPTPEALVIDVIDLTKKMDTLFEYQDVALNANGGPAVNDIYLDSPNSPELFFQGPEITDVTGLGELDEDPFPSRYSPLFDSFAMERSSGSESQVEPADGPGEGIQVWNEIDRVWEEVEWQLSKRAETLCEDSEIIQLKVDLAKQAKMLASLGKKVTDLREKERRFATRGVEIVDLTSHDLEASRQKSDSRSLFLRLSHLEDRLVCDEIAVQHLSMESYTVEHEGDSMLSSTEHDRSSGTNSFRQRPIPLPAPIDVERKHYQTLHQTGGSTISFSDESSFRPYAKRSASASRTSDQVIELDTSSSSYSRVQSYGSGTPHEDRIMQSSFGLDAVSSSNPSEVPRRDLHLASVAQGARPERQKDSNIDYAYPQSERLLITRPLGALSTRATFLNSSEESNAQLSSAVLTQDTVVGAVSMESRGKGSMTVVAESESPSTKSEIDEHKARHNLMLLKRLSRDSNSDETPPLCPTSKLHLGPRARQLATRLKRHSLGSYSEDQDALHQGSCQGPESLGEDKQSHDPTLASNASSIFRLQTISVPHLPFPVREYSGLTGSRSSRSHSDLATEIDNLILRYTASEEGSKSTTRLRHHLV